MKLLLHMLMFAFAAFLVFAIDDYVLGLSGICQDVWHYVKCALFWLGIWNMTRV